jgi:hypothetical protein
MLLKIGWITKLTIKQSKGPRLSMKDYKLLIITPATMRIDIVAKTIQSFKEKMFPKLIDRRYVIDGKTKNKIAVEVILNVDYVGEIDNDLYDDYDITLTVNKHFFVGFCRYGLDNCSLISAFKWLWKMAAESDADYVFYLEDDWLLLEEVDPFAMIEVMENYPNLATLRFPFCPTDLQFSKNWKHKFWWNGRFFLCPKDERSHIGWCGHPSMVNPKFIRETLPLLDRFTCPERQMKGFGNSELNMIIKKWDYGVFGIPLGPAYVKDIGREWRKEKAIKKCTNTTWICEAN